jgi:CBS domain-containing protein
MKVRDAMTRDVELVDPDETVQFAAQLMADIDAGAIPVGRARKPAGVLTDRDIIIRVVARGADPAAVRIGEVMSSDIVTCREDDLAAAVVRLMGERQIRRMPVVDADGYLIGIVSLGDLATVGDAGDERVDERSGEALREISEPPGDAELMRAAGSKPARGNETIGG